MIQTQKWLFGKRVLIVDEQHRGSVIFEMPEDKSTIGGCDGWIYSLWVDEPYRGKKIATALLDAAELVAKEMGCKQVGLEWIRFEAESWTLDWYKRQGYQEAQGNYKHILLKKEL